MIENKIIISKYLSYGIYIVILFIASLFLIALFVRYPEVLEAKAKITSKLPPLLVFSKSSGEIKQLFFKDKEKVQKGNILCIIQSTGNYMDVLLLEEKLKQLSTIQEAQKYDDFTIPENLNTGELFNYLTDLNYKFNNFKIFLKNNLVFIKIKYTNEKVDKYESMIISQEKKVNNLIEKIKNSEDNYNKQLVLFKKGIVSKNELDLVQEEYLSDQRLLQSEIINKNEYKLQLLESKILVHQIQNERFEEYLQRKNEILYSSKKLLGAIEEWKHKHAILASIDGTINYEKIISVGYFVGNEDHLFTIIPDINKEKNQIIASALFPSNGIGKLFQGTKATITIDAFPFKEFGIIETKVNDISVIPVLNNNTKEYNYRIIFLLNNPLITNYNYLIPYKSEMDANVKIYLKDRSLFERVFESLIKK